MSESTGRDTAGVIAPPPLIALGAVIVGLVADYWQPIGVIGALVPRTVRFVLAAALVLAAGILALSALQRFRSARTHVEPWKPSTALVTTGIYAKTRNPMYQALGLLVLAVVFGAASDWTLVAGVVAAVILHFGVVVREERYLAAKFGEDYLRYKTRVPRYGWPF